MSPYPLTNFEIQKYYQNRPKFNGVYSKNNLSKMMHGSYIINLDEYESIGTHWIALHLNAKIVTYFGSFGVQHIQNKITEFIGNKNIIKNVYRIQEYNSMCGNFCIGFIDFM